MARSDLTTGSIPRGVLSLAVPMVVGSIFHSIQSLVDMFFVGKLGPASVAAVGMSGTIIMILITVFIGINMATVAMISRAIGAGDKLRARHVAGQCLILTIAISVVVGTIGYFGSSCFLRTLGAEAEVANLGTGYLRVIFPGIFFLCVIFMISAIFQGMGDTMTPLLLGILATVCNVILNPILIFGYLGFPEMGVRGSALATVIARFVAFTAGLVILSRGRLRVRIADMRPNLQTMWQFVAVGVPGSLQMAMRTLMGLVLMAIVAKFGTIVVAAYTVGFRVRMLGLFPSFGFGGSAATMVGQNLGAKQPGRAQRSALTAAGMAALAAAAVAIVLIIFAPQIISVFNDSPAVVASGAYFLRVTSAGLVTAATGIVLGRAMTGAGDTISPMIITLFALWGFQVPAALLLSGTRTMWGVSIPFLHLFGKMGANGESGVWYAMLAASILQAAATAIWFSRGKWKHKKI